MYVSKQFLKEIYKRDLWMVHTLELVIISFLYHRRKYQILQSIDPIFQRKYYYPWTMIFTIAWKLFRQIAELNTVKISKYQKIIGVDMIS